MKKAMSGIALSGVGAMSFAVVCMEDHNSAKQGRSPENIDLVRLAQVAGTSATSAGIMSDGSFVIPNTTSPGVKFVAHTRRDIRIAELLGTSASSTNL